MLINLHVSLSRFLQWTAGVDRLHAVRQRWRVRVVVGQRLPESGFGGQAESRGGHDGCGHDGCSRQGHIGAQQKVGEHEPREFYGQLVVHVAVPVVICVVHSLTAGQAVQGQAAPWTSPKAKAATAATGTTTATVIGRRRPTAVPHADRPTAHRFRHQELPARLLRRSGRPSRTISGQYPPGPGDQNRNLGTGTLGPKDDGYSWKGRIPPGPWFFPGAQIFGTTNLLV